MNSKKVARLLATLQGIAQSGKTYGRDIFDLERYQQLSEVTQALLAELTDFSSEQLQFYLENDAGYATPKVDIRGVVFHDSKLLLVKEKSDGCWTLPGGWADIGYSPFEIAQKETQEEAGIEVKAQRLIAVKDKAKHDYPVSLTYIYKMFISCVPVSFTLKGGVETSEAGFFSREQIEALDLSENRTSREDIEMAFQFNEASFYAYCD